MNTHHHMEITATSAIAFGRGLSRAASARTSAGLWIGGPRLFAVAAIPMRTLR